MNVKVNEVLKGIDGVEELKSETGRPLTLKDICVNSVLSPIEGDDDRKKFEKYEIFKKFRDAKGEVELTIEEVALVKKCIGKIQPPLVMGQCFDFLENKQEKKESEESSMKIKRGLSK